MAFFPPRRSDFYMFLCDVFQNLLSEWRLSDKCEVITTDTAKNMLGIFNIPTFPVRYVSGKCVNHILQLCIKVCFIQSFTAPH